LSGSPCGEGLSAGDLDVLDAQDRLPAGGAQRVQDLADLVVDVLDLGVFLAGLDPGLDDCIFRRGGEPEGVQLGHGDAAVGGELLADLEQCGTRRSPTSVKSLALKPVAGHEIIWRAANKHLPRTRSGMRDVWKPRGDRVETPIQGWLPAPACRSPAPVACTGTAPQTGCQAADRTRAMTLAHSSLLRIRTGPSEFLESRTATMPGMSVATSTQLPPPLPL